MKYLKCILLMICLMASGCSFVNNEKKGDNVKININNKEYIINLDSNETSLSFLKMLPLKINMEDLNNNEKYAYLDKKLPTNSYKPNVINKGDIMLFGDDCLVLFYKSFKTSYSYTKIGHVEDMPDLDSNELFVEIYK